jgi:hypothetical protein
MNDRPYTNEELRQLHADAVPQRREYCPKCKNFIPSFEALSHEAEKSLRRSRLAAIAEVRKLTGCNMQFAKIWAIHPNGPHPEGKEPPCPYCGRLLFSDKTRQCIRCGWDWHDPENPIQHVVNLRQNKPA